MPMPSRTEPALAAYNLAKHAGDEDFKAKERIVYMYEGTLHHDTATYLYVDEKPAYSTAMLEKMKSETYFTDTVERLASGTETVETIAEGLEEGLLKEFLKTFVKLRTAHPPIHGSQDDARLLAVYMTTPTPKLCKKSLETAAQYDVLSVGLWLAVHIEFWYNP